ncbi:MAG: hypothetical protein ACK5N8_00835 [Alphaproteobacteria bacterium]
MFTNKKILMIALSVFTIATILPFASQASVHFLTEAEIEAIDNQK